jgi:threonylcarbamoyladenosine tRNA methylthiotransferase MtaB
MERILDQAKDLERLRISSIEVTELDEHLISLMKSTDRIARHLHIPLQAGSDEILKAMGRPYTTDEYYEKIEWIREQMPGISVSCDLITGFPGETDELFEETMAFIRKCRFSFLHVFPYSPRANTRAAAMKNQIDPRIKKERTARAMALSNELAGEYRKEWTGKEAVVITEECRDGFTSGYTSQYIPVLIKGELPHGEAVRIVMREYKDRQMYGELL